LKFHFLPTVFVRSFLSLVPLFLVLLVSGWFCHTGPISLCVDLFVFICVYFVFLFHTAYVLYYCEHGGVDLMEVNPNP